VGLFDSLQVLVSIQAFILCEHPYYNEPGYESHPKQNSETYNQVIRSGTVLYAMISHLENPPSGFEEVCGAHFFVNRLKIISRIQEWMAQPKVSSMQSHIIFPGSVKTQTLFEHLQSLLMSLKNPW